MAKPKSKKIEKRLRKGAKSLGKSIKKIRKSRERKSAAKIAGVAVAGAAGVAGIAAGVKYLRNRRGAATLHVAPNDGDGWKLSAKGSAKPLATFETKKPAVIAARKEAAKAAPSELVIHRADGTVQQAHSYGAA